jgi:ABC-2 type transport system permease protein
MTWRRFAAMTQKELIQILRDPRSLLVVVAMPILLMFAYGYGISFDIKHVPICVLDREGSQQSQDLLKRFQSSEYFRVVKAVDSDRELVAAIDSGRCQLAIVIPWDFSRKLAAGRPVSVQAIADASDNNTANVSMSYGEAVIQGYSQQVQLEWLQRQGLAGASSASAPIRVDARTWFNENLESSAGIVPGVVVMVMAVVGTFLTSLTIAREWERGTMEQLISTPVTSMEVMLGKLAPYFVIGMLDTTLCAVLGVRWFDVPFRGHWSVFFLSSTLFLIVVLSLGYFFSVIGKSQLAANQMAMLATFLPTFLLSGFIFPIDQMPVPVQVISWVLPARYFMTIIRSVFLKGTSLARLQTSLLPLAVFAALLALLATRAFHKRLE